MSLPDAKSYDKQNNLLSGIHSNFVCISLDFVLKIVDFERNLRFHGEGPDLYSLQ